MGNWINIDKAYFILKESLLGLSFFLVYGFISSFGIIFDQLMFNFTNLNLNVMKFNLKLSALLLIISFVGITSCRKDDDEEMSNSYIGSWTQSKPNDLGTVRSDLTLTEKTFNLAQYQSPFMTKFLEASGNLTVVGNEMNLDITKIGTLESLTSFKYYEKGTDEYDNLISMSPFGAGGEGTFSVENNKLTVKLDTNIDGIINELDEEFVFDRK